MQRKTEADGRENKKMCLIGPHVKLQYAIEWTQQMYIVLTIYLSTACSLKMT